MSSSRTPRSLLLAFALILPLLLISLPSPGRAQTTNHLVLSEVLYDPFGEEPAGEWVELFNPTNTAVDLTGWKLVDNTSQDILPSFVLGPVEYLVIAAREDAFRAANPGFSGSLVSLESAIGNGLSNSGDRILLRDPADQLVDAMSYGEDTTALAPACPDVPEGQTLARVPPDSDTDTAADWVAQAVPSPGGPGAFPPATSTPTPTHTPSWTPDSTGTPTATATPAAWPKLYLSEVLYDAVQSDADGAWEWVELFNPGEQAVQLASWRIGDNSGQDVIPVFELAAGHYLVVAATAAGFLENHPDFAGNLVSLEGSIGNGLSNTGDVVRLIAPDGLVIDAMSYGNNAEAFLPPCPGVPAGNSLARVPSWQDSDTRDDWVPQALPNPGAAGLEPAATPIPTPTQTPTPTTSPAPTHTVTPVPTGTRLMLPLVMLNEVLPRPDAIDWDGNGAVDASDEWIELFNAGPDAVDLGGWMLDDILGGGSRPYTFQPGTTLGPGGFLVRYRSATGVALNQDADTVHLITPEGDVADSFSYSNPRRDASYSRTLDGAGEWTDSYPPSPGGPNLAPTATPTATPSPTATPFPLGVTLNEILPDPRTVDWDANGTADFRDEWVELHNAGPAPAALGGWVLADDTKSYTLPLGIVVWPGSTLLLFRDQTGLALGDQRDEVSLLRPDGSLADRFAYDAGPGPDRSYCRDVDGTGIWTKECYVTPGQPNRLLPSPPPSSGGPAATATPAGWTTSIAAARTAAADTRVTLTGVVIFPPGLLPRTIYIQDASSGIKVYLRNGDFPALALGNTLRVTGWTRDFHGEAEISVPDSGYLAVLGSGTAPIPLMVTTGSLGEAHEGQLVQFAGRVARFETRALVLDDGTGPARIYFPEELPWRRPYVNVGEFWRAVGVVGQYAFDGPPYVGGHRLMPRFATDVSNAPGWLPMTGWGEAGQYDMLGVRTED